MMDIVFPTWRNEWVSISRVDRGHDRTAKFIEPSGEVIQRIALWSAQHED